MNKFLGVGIGLRRQHFNDVMNSTDGIDFFELLSENFMNYGGLPRKTISHLKKSNVPLICHGVGLSLGSSDELDPKYINCLEELLNFIDAPWFSDHLSFASENKIHFHDLVPVLRTDEAVEFISNKINKVQDYFKRPFAIENVSYYAESTLHQMSETQFIQKLIDNTNCKLLLDVNNVYVNAVNHGYNMHQYIDELPLDHVIQIHLAGHDERGDMLIDTHGNFVIDEVWDLYRYTLKKIKRPISTLIEWDNDVPNYQVLKDEAFKAKKILIEVF